MRSIEEQAITSLVLSHGLDTLVYDIVRVESRFILTFNISQIEAKGGESVTVKISVKENDQGIKLTNLKILKLVETPSSIVINIPGFDEAQIDNAVELAKITGNAMETTATGMEIAAIAGMALSFDASGTALKFALTCKLISRFSFLNLKYGSMLGPFYRKASMNFAKANEDDNDAVAILENGWKGRLSDANIHVDIIEKMRYKLIAYAISWIMKLAGMVFMNSIIKSQYPETKKTIFVYYQKKLHFVILNVTMADGVFFAARSIAHNKAMTSGGNIISIIFLMAAIFESIIFICRKDYKPTIFSEEERELIAREVKRIKDPYFKISLSINKLIKKLKARNSLNLPPKIPIELLKVSDANTLGYMKVFEPRLQIDLCRMDDAVVKFKTSSMIASQSVLLNSTSNAELAFLYRTYIYQIMIVGLAHLPLMALGMICIMEFYTLVLTSVIAKKGYFKASIQMIKRVTSSFYLFAFITLLFGVYFVAIGSKSDTPYLLQIMGVLTMIAGFVLEVGFVVAVLFRKGINLLRKKKERNGTTPYFDFSCCCWKKIEHITAKSTRLNSPISNSNTNSRRASCKSKVSAYNKKQIVSFTRRKKNGIETVKKVE